MTKRRNELKLMIMDACVLIDYLKADRSVLNLIVKYVGPIYVASPVLDEVNEIENEEELAELNIIVIEPELEDAFAATGELGPTSFEDRICLLTAKRHGFTCITNDKNLRKLCRKEGVPMIWGLQLLLELHRSGGLPGKDAISIARQIQKNNSKHITQQLIDRFVSMIETNT